MVRVLSPVPETVLKVGVPVTINAEASYDGGYIQKVEFYANRVKLGEVRDEPYSLTWIPDAERLNEIEVRAIAPFLFSSNALSQIQSYAVVVQDRESFQS